MRDVIRSFPNPVQVGILVGLCGLAPLAASARDYVVTRTDDPAIVGTRLCPSTSLGGCSLREAVLAANQNPGQDRIVLGKLTYTLSLVQPGTDGRTGALRVTDPVTIEGVSSSLTRIRWANALHHDQSVVRFEQPASAASLMQRLTVSHGRGVEGGCLYAAGELKLADAVVEQCEATTGGGLQLRGTLVLQDTVFRDNRANAGGAIEAAGWNTIIADGADFLDNEATFGGGAVRFRGFPNADGSVMVGAWRNGGAGSRFIGNSAEYGGALSVYGNTTINFYSYPSNGPRTLFENNVAADAGGAVKQTGHSLTLEHALFKQNAAGKGGAIHADRALVLRDVEFDGNSAQDSVGGALSTNYVADLPLVRIDIDRAAFNGNSAALLGGGIASECQELVLRNVSFNANQVNSSTGRGSAVASSGHTFMAHMTSSGHASNKSTFARTFQSYCGSQPFSIANSVIGSNDSCYSQFGGPIASNGGNLFGPGATQCQSLSGGIDKRHSSSSVFGLSLGTYGGVMQVLGWNVDGQTRPQVGFGTSAYCSPHDVRDLPRPGTGCDSGAFEQQ